MGHEVEIIVSKGVCAVDYLPIVNSVPNAKQVAEPKKGRAVQMNAGAAAAKGAILAFLHADVWPPQGFFDAKGALQDARNSYCGIAFDMISTVPRIIKPAL